MSCSVESLVRRHRVAFAFVPPGRAFHSSLCKHASASMEPQTVHFGFAFRPVHSNAFLQAITGQIGKGEVTHTLA